MAKHGYTGEDGGDSDMDFWDASFELMDLAEAHWKKSLVGVIRCWPRHRLPRLMP
jgi:hypothetical protein